MITPRKAPLVQAASALRGAADPSAAPLAQGPLRHLTPRRSVNILRAPYPDGRREWLPSEFCTTPQLETLMGLIGTLHAYDAHTSRHSMQVERFADRLAEMMGLSEEDRHVVRLAALLHDIGKVAVPISILAKPAKLTPAEFAVVKRHPTVGAKIIEPIPFLKPAAPLVLHHHEWYDGSGYQHGLAGDQIPLGARIIQTADCIDAMISPRSYKKGYTTSRVISELQKGRGTQFDPTIADCAVRLLLAQPQKLMS